MRSLAIIATTAIAIATAAPAFAEPTQMWELDGLKNPESALPDLTSAVIFVSNVDGSPVEKDGKGAISKVSFDGKLVEAEWISGLNAPKGMAALDRKLYVADIDELIEIDIKEGKITNRYPAKDAKFLNDVAASSVGHVYVSDMVTNKIWRLADGKFEVWLEDEKLLNPNGLTVLGEKLIVASWGKMDGEGFSTSIPGHLLEVSIPDKSITALSEGKPIGNLDGLEATDEMHFLVTDWMSGGLFRANTETGETKKILPLGPGSADIGYLRATRTIFIPMMNDGKLLAYKLDK